MSFQFVQIGDSGRQWKFQHRIGVHSLRIRLIKAGGRFCDGFDDQPLELGQGHLGHMSVERTSAGEFRIAVEIRVFPKYPQIPVSEGMDGGDASVVSLLDAVPSVQLHRLHSDAVRTPQEEHPLEFFEGPREF